MMTPQPANLDAALNYLSASKNDDDRWQILAIILREICKAKEIDLELPIDYEPPF